MQVSSSLLLTAVRFRVQEQSVAMLPAMLERSKGKQNII